MSDPQKITLVSASPPVAVTAWRGITPPVPAGGGSGWTIQARPRRKALTVWDGTDPLRELVPLFLDGVTDNTSVEPECAQIEQLSRPPMPGAEPPLVRVIGIIPHPGLDWIVESLEWDAAPVYSRSGYRTQQGVVVHLLEYVADDRLAEIPAAEHARRAATAKAAAAAKTAGVKVATTTAKTYLVVAGDTLITIAARKLGSYKRWGEIRDLNNLRDPNSIRPGQRLQLP